MAILSRTSPASPVCERQLRPRYQTVPLQQLGPLRVNRDFLALYCHGQTQRKLPDQCHRSVGTLIIRYPRRRSAFSVGGMSSYSCFLSAQALSFAIPCRYARAQLIENLTHQINGASPIISGILLGNFTIRH